MLQSSLRVPCSEVAKTLLGVLDGEGHWRWMDLEIEPYLVLNPDGRVQINPPEPTR